jgi:KEOPS complex subunit Cgi121
MMSEVRLLFGKPRIHSREQLISKIKELNVRHGCIAQVLDADMIVSERHIFFAAEKAMSAFSEGRNIAKDAGMEIMRYASGERQIERARVMGVTDHTERIALVLVCAGNQCSWPDSEQLSGIIEGDGQGCSFNARAVIEAFHISSEELEAVGEQRIEDLVIERVALADTYR